MMSMSVCVCLYVCVCLSLTASISLQQHINFFVNVPTAVARCCSGSIVINVACFRFYG